MLGDEAARGDDHPLAVLPLDPLNKAETREHAAGRDGEQSAVAVFDQCVAAPHVLHDLVRQNFIRQLGRTGRRRLIAICNSALT